MYRSFILVISLFFIGCTVKPVVGNDFFTLFTEINKLVEEEKIVNKKEIYFTKNYLSEVNINDKNSLFLLSIPGHIKSISSHYEKVFNSLGCMSINGSDEEGGPISLDIEFIEEQGKWRINYMYLDFINTKNDYRKEAKCPKKV